MRPASQAATLRAEAAQWELRSLSARSFHEMIEYQRQADRSATLAGQSEHPEPASPAKPPAPDPFAP